MGYESKAHLWTLSWGFGISMFSGPRLTGITENEMNERNSKVIFLSVLKWTYVQSNKNT